MTSRGAANAYQSKCEIGGEMFLLRAIVDDSVDPAVVVTAYRTAKIEKYWGKLLHPVGAQRAVPLRLAPHHFAPPVSASDGPLIK